MFFRQRCWQGQPQNTSLVDTKLSGRFHFLIFSKNFRTQQNTTLGPNDQVWPPLRDTVLLRLAHKIVEPVQRLLQSPACEDAAQARHCQHEQQQQYENGQGNLD
jgi:hypothetical protein